MDHALLERNLSTLLGHLGLPYDGCTCTPEQDVLRVEIKTAEPSRIIGWHGETLSSLQHLLKAMMRARETGDTTFLVLDVDGYRKTQEEKVRKIAEQKADFVRRTGSRIALQPMSPYFRRIVHLHIANTPSFGDLTTESVGQGDFRQIVLKLKNEVAKPQASEELTPVMAADDDLGNLDV